MATKAVILSQKKGDAADILLPHTSADLTGYTHASVQDGESVKDALDYLLKTQTGEGSELEGRVSALEKEIDTVEEAAQAAQTAASAAQTAAEQWSADKPGIVQRVENLEAQKAPKAHASAEETYGKGTRELYGHVKLSDTVGEGTQGVSSGIAATPKAVADKLKEYLPDRIVQESIDTQNGFIKYASGLIVQWGRGNIDTTYTDITLPTPFTKECFVAYGADLYSIAETTETQPVYVPIWSTKGTTTTTIRFLNSGEYALHVFSWLAIGK